MDKKFRIRTFFQIILLLTLLVGIPAYVFLCRPDLIAFLESFDRITDFFRTNLLHGSALFVLAEVLQIVIPVLPGELFQFAAGYLYGFLPGFVLLIAGVLAGTFLSFFIARMLGADLLAVFFKRETMDKYITWMNSKKGYILVFVLYLIPGIPKDLLCYAAGISRIPFKAFLAVSTAGRLPGLCGSLLVGSLYMKGHHAAMWIILGLAAAIFLLCLWKRKAIHEELDKLYDRLSQTEK